MVSCGIPSLLRWWWRTIICYGLGLPGINQTQRWSIQGCSCVFRIKMRRSAQSMFARNHASIWLGPAPLKLCLLLAIRCWAFPNFRPSYSCNFSHMPKTKAGQIMRIEMFKDSAEYWLKTTSSSPPHTMKKTQLPCLQHSQWPRDRSVQHAANAPYTPGRDLFWRYLYFSSFLNVHLIWKFAVKGLSLCFFQLRHIMMNFEHFLYPLAFIGIRAFFNPFLGPSMPVSEFSGAQNISERDVRGKVCMASSWARSCCTLCLTMNVTSRELFGGSRAFLDIVSKLRTYIEGFFVIHIWVSIGSLAYRKGSNNTNNTTQPSTTRGEVLPAVSRRGTCKWQGSQQASQPKALRAGRRTSSLKKKNTLTWGRNSCQKLWSLQRTPETWCCTCSQLNFSCAEDDWLFLCNEAPLGLRSRFCRHLGIQDSKQRIKLCTQVFRGVLTSSKMLVHEWIHFSGSRWKEVHKSSQSFQSDLTMNILPCQLNVDHELQQFHTNFVAEPTKPIRRPDKLQCLAGIHEVWSSRIDTSQHMQNILGEQMPQWFWGRLESPPGTACDEMASKDRLALSAAKSSQGSQNPQHWSFVSLPRKIDAAVDAFHAWKASEKLYTSNIFKFSNVTLWQKKGTKHWHKMQNRYAHWPA